MKKTLTTIFLFTLIQISVSAQSAPDIEWALPISGGSDEYPKDIAVDQDGNVYIVGSFSGTADFNPDVFYEGVSSAGGLDIFILKLDSDGDLVWVETIGGTDDQQANAISISDSHLFIAGYHKGTADFDTRPSYVANRTSAGGKDAFILKLDLDGVYVWSKSTGSTGDDEAMDISVTPDGVSCTVGMFEGTADFNPGTGTTELTSNGGTDIYVQKFTNAGSLTYAGSYGNSTSDESVSAVDMDASGNAYICGWFAGTVDFDPEGTTNELSSDNSSEDLFVQKLSASGSHEWSIRIGDSDEDKALDIAVNALGGVYVSGSYTGLNVDFDPDNIGGNLTGDWSGDKQAFILKLNEAGEYQWANGHGNYNADIGYAVGTDELGYGYLVSFNNDYPNFNDRAQKVSKYNPDGDVVVVLASVVYLFWPEGIVIDGSNIFNIGYFRTYNSDFGVTDGSSFVLSPVGGDEGYIQKFYQEPMPHWDGSVSTDWNLAANWSTSTVPSSTDTVVIQSYPANQPHVTSSMASPAECHRLTVQTGASLTIDAGKAMTVNGPIYNYGTIHVKANASSIGSLITYDEVNWEGGPASCKIDQYLEGSGGTTPDGLFWYVGNPVQNARADNYLPVTTDKLWGANESTQSYFGITTNITLSNYNGYIARVGATGIRTFDGFRFRTGNISRSNMSRTGTTAPNRGYHLVANPYPSTLNWSTVSTTNLEPSYWVRTNDGNSMMFDTYNVTSGLGTNNTGNGAVTEFIPPTQGFWVRVDGDGNTGSYQMDNADRSHAPWSNIYKVEAENGVVRLALSDSEVSDEQIVYFDASAQDIYDAYDSRKFWTEDVPQLYTNVNDDTLAINGLYSTTTSPTVPLGIKLPEQGQYSLNANDITVVGEPVHLEDTYLNVFQDLNVNPTYSFNSDAGNIGDRFVLHFGNLTVEVQEDAEKTSHVYAANGQLNIQLASNIENANLQVLDMAGRTIATRALDQTQTVMSMNVPAGVYLIRIEAEKGADTHKVILQ